MNTQQAHSSGRQLVILITKLAINALALFVADAMFKGIWLETTEAKIAAPIMLALLNTYLRPLVTLLTLPITIVSLGLFRPVINAAMLKLVGWLIPGFHVEGFWTAVGGALVISIVSLLLDLFIRPPNVHVRIDRR